MDRADGEVGEAQSYWGEEGMISSVLFLFALSLRLSILSALLNRIGYPFF